MNNKITPKRNQIWQFDKIGGGIGSLVIVSVNDTRVEYKFIEDDGSLSRRPFPMTRALFDAGPDALEYVGVMLLVNDD